jgi:hypothetical protein
VRVRPDAEWHAQPRRVSDLGMPVIQKGPWYEVHADFVTDFRLSPQTFDVAKAPPAGAEVTPTPETRQARLRGNGAAPQRGEAAEVLEAAGAAVRDAPGPPAPEPAAGSTDMVTTGEGGSAAGPPPPRALGRRRRGGA